MEERGNTAVLILSCDKYTDIWNPFFTLFFRYWDNCPFPVYLGTNEKQYSFPNVNVIHSGKGEDWSNDTIRILKQIPEKYVIVILEDYFLYAQADNEKLKRCISVMEKTNATFMRIACFPSDHFADYAYDVMEDNPEFCTTRKSAHYRVTLQAGLWNREKFIDLINPGESPWDFEINGTKRSLQKPEPYLGLVETKGLRYVHGPVPYLCTALSHGVWMRDAIRLCEKEKVSIDLSKRPVESRWKYVKRRTYHSMPFQSRRIMDYVNSRIKRFTR
jgi:hypothetical protein